METNAKPWSWLKTTEKPKPAPVAQYRYTGSCRIHGAVYVWTADAVPRMVPICGRVFLGGVTGAQEIVCSERVEIRVGA